MKKEKARNRKAEYRYSLSDENKTKALKRQRDLYAKNSDKKKKNREEYNEKKKGKDEKAKKRLEELKNANENLDELAETTGKNILLKSTKNLRKILAEPKVYCQFCEKSFEPNSILKHISKNKACNSFYGPKLAEFRKEQKTVRMRQYRKETGNQRELIKKKEAYASNSELRETKKVANKKSYEVYKKKEKASKDEEQKKKDKESVKRYLVLSRKSSEDRNENGRKRMSWLKKTLSICLKSSMI